MLSKGKTSHGHSAPGTHKTHITTSACTAAKAFVSAVANSSPCSSGPIFVGFCVPVLPVGRVKVGVDTALPSFPGFVPVLLLKFVVVDFNMIRTWPSGEHAWSILVETRVLSVSTVSTLEMVSCEEPGTRSEQFSPRAERTPSPLWLPLKKRGALVIKHLQYNDYWRGLYAGTPTCKAVI